LKNARSPLTQVNGSYQGWSNCRGTIWREVLHSQIRVTTAAPCRGSSLPARRPGGASASPAPDPTAQVLLPAIRSERRRSPECIATGEMRRFRPFECRRLAGSNRP
jgi:hypothetical protein